MSRRSASLSILLGVFALIAIGVVWISISVIGGPSPNESRAPVTELERTTHETAFDPSLAPAPSPDPVSQDVDATTAARAAVPQAQRESAALPAEDLELRDALWVEGRVIVPPGTPPDELVEVLADGSPFETRPLHSSPIAADGSFRVAFAPGTLIGTLDLVAKYLYLEQAITVSPAQPPHDILLTPRLGGRIHGRVVPTPAALPLRSTIVGSSGQARLASGDFVRAGTVDEGLEFDLSGVPAGSDYLIRIVAPGCSSPPLRGVQVELGRTTFVVVDLGLAATVSGWVSDASGTALNRTQVVARSLEVHGGPSPSLHGTDVISRFHEINHALSDPSGRFAFSQLAPGDWELTATALGFAKSLPLRVRLEAGRSVDGVRLSLRGAGRIAGRVLGVDGRPAVYAGVGVTSDRLLDRELQGSGFLASNFVTTDKHGDFEFDSLAPGNYRIEARWDDPAQGGEASSPVIVLAEGECVENVVIRIERPGRIEGRVTGPEGRPAVEVVVQATEEETGITHSSFGRSDESGKFTLERIPPGEYLLVVRDGRLAQVGETRIALRPGEVVQAEISVREGTMLWVFLEGFGEEPGTVTVSVFDEKGATVGTASPVRPWNWNGASDSLSCTIGPILPGKYVIEAVAAEKKASQSVTLSGQESESIHLSASR